MAARRAARLVAGKSLDAMIGNLVGGRLTPVDPSYARKLPRDLHAWARSHGIDQPRDFAAVEQLFGDVRVDLCETTFQFGRDGKAAYRA